MAYKMGDIYIGNKIVFYDIRKCYIYVNEIELYKIGECKIK